MRVIDPWRSYPRWWRVRYGDEMAVLLEDHPPTRRDRVDLARGALDAWLHPPVPSLVPAISSLVGGGLWTMLAVIVLLQPTRADWPGYLLELIPLALVAVVWLAVAVIGLSLRLGDSGGRAAMFAVGVAIVGFLAWAIALLGTLAGIADAAALAATQTVAMVGTAWIGVLLVRAGDEPIGAILATAPLLLIIPTTLGWLAFGTLWTVVGLVALVQRTTRIGPASIAR